jgi:hypothetical protein
MIYIPTPRMCGHVLQDDTIMEVRWYVATSIIGD